MRGIHPPLVAVALFLAGVLAGAAAQTGQGEKAAAKKDKADAQALKYVATEEAPRAAGPYSQGVVAGGFLFCAGQTPRNPKTGEQVTGGIEAATERALDNLEAVLKAEGFSFADVVKATVFLTKADDFQPMNGVYGRRMGENKPARTTVFVAGLPGNAPIEIELIARTRK